MDNVIDGVYSENHKILTIVYMSYCNILSSSHIVLSSNYMVHSSYFQIDFIVFIYICVIIFIFIITTITITIIAILNLIFELTNYHKVTCIIWTYYKCLGDHNHAKYMSCEQKIYLQWHIITTNCTHWKLAIFIKITMWNQKPHHGLGYNSWEVRK